MFLALGTLVPSCLFSSGDVWSSVWKRSKWVLVTHVPDTAPPLLPRSWWPSGLAISETVQITSHRKSWACRRCHYMPDSKFTIHSRKFIDNREQEPHNIISRQVCHYIWVILEESAISSEGLEHLFVCMAYLCSIRTEWHKFWCLLFVAIVVYLSPWSIEVIIILLFLWWGEVSVFSECFSIFGQWMYLTVVAGAPWVYYSISICWWHWLLVFHDPTVPFQPFFLN